MKPAYPARVRSRLLSLFLIVALALAPAGMPGTAAFAAPPDRHAAVEATHDGTSHSAHPCADVQGPSKEAPENCCVMACIAIPAAGGELAVHTLAPSLRQPLPLARDPHGLRPEADPPPPRIS